MIQEEVDPWFEIALAICGPYPIRLLRLPDQLERLHFTQAAFAHGLVG